jgi:hypothetical protein
LGESPRSGFPTRAEDGCFCPSLFCCLQDMRDGVLVLLSAELDSKGFG